MIYQINKSQIPLAVVGGCSIITMSADSTNALITGSNIEGLDIINEFNDSELSSLLAQEFWHQPCSNC